jgi:uncharacterized protein YqgC (DUF456 family)
MKYIVVVLSLINGLWMFIDGIYVSVNGKYIGPDKPGPWASLVGLTGTDVFKLGPVFIIFGAAWLCFVGAFFAEVSWARNFGLILSVLTLWYLPFGTLISLVVIVGLMFVIKN